MQDDNESPRCSDESHAARPARPLADLAVIERAAAILRAAGEVSRLRVLNRLSFQEACVTELADEFGEGLSTMSQRLRLLCNEGLVTRRREGKHVYYCLDDEHVADLIGIALEHASESLYHQTGHSEGR